MLEIVGNETEWALEKARPTVKIQIEVDKGDTGIHLEVFGTACSDPVEEMKAEQKEEEEKMGVEPVIKVNAADCSLSMDQMAVDEKIVECKESCPNEGFTREGNN